MLMRTMTSYVAHDGVMTSLIVDLILTDSLSRRSCMIVRLSTCCDAGGDTVLRTMTSCVVHDDVMTSLVVDLILTDSLSRRSCMIVRLGTCCDAGGDTVLITMTSCVSGASASDGRKAAN